MKIHHQVFYGLSVCESNVSCVVLRIVPLAAIILLFSCCKFVSAEDPYQQVWSVSDWFDQRDSPTALAIGPNGNVFLGGRTSEVTGTPDVDPTGGVVAQYDVMGNRKWISTLYDERGLDHIFEINVGNDGSLYATGETYRFPGGAEAFLVKLDPNGDRLWERHIGSPSNEFGRGLAIDSTGNVFLAGTTTGQVGAIDYFGYDSFLTKYSPQGDELWTQQFDSDVGDFARAIAVDGPDNIYFAGSNSVTLNDGALLTKFDSGGSIIWNQTLDYAAFPGRGSRISEVTTDEDGFVYTVGTTDFLFEDNVFAFGGSPYVAKHDATGALLWQNTLEGDTISSVSDVTIDSHGNVYIVGGYQCQQPLLGKAQQFRRSTLAGRAWDSAQRRSGWHRS